jgi:hypothetical protein
MEILGCNLGKELLPADPETNPLGFFENLAALEFNEKLLKELGTDWRNPQPLRVNYFREGIKPQAEILLDKLIQELVEKDVTALKKPRSALLLDLWAPALEKQNLDLKIVAAMRNPSEVAASLLKRDSLETILGLHLWAQATINTLRFARKHTNHFVFYDELLAQPKETVIELSSSLQLPINYKLLHDFLAAVVKPELKHHTAKESDKPTLEVANTMYEYIMKFTNATSRDFSDELLNEWQANLDLSIHKVDGNRIIQSQLNNLDALAQKRDVGLSSTVERPIKALRKFVKRFKK